MDNGYRIEVDRNIYHQATKGREIHTACDAFVGRLRTVVSNKVGYIE